MAAAHQVTWSSITARRRHWRRALGALLARVTGLARRSPGDPTRIDTVLKYVSSRKKILVGSVNIVHTYVHMTMHCVHAHTATGRRRWMEGWRMGVV